MNKPVRAGAWNLLGQELDGGWKVTAPAGWDLKTGQATDPDATGGHNSVTYIVERERVDGRQRAFLKASDLTPVMTAFDPAKELTKLMTAYQFESDVLRVCSDGSMNRIATALDSGQIKVGENLQDLAPYIIFDLAEGDVRRRVKAISERVRTLWWFRVMHHIAVGLGQLHKRRISHQDLKPSNILSFGDQKGCQIADLGRSICDNIDGPYDRDRIPGDSSYAAPELLYGYHHPEWSVRHLGADLYQFGSMIFYFSTGLGATTLLLRKLDRIQRPSGSGGTWVGSYPEILPDLQNAFTSVLNDLRPVFDAEFAAALTSAAQQLCTPDPELRGHPSDRRRVGSNFSMERYISLFDRLAKRAEIQIRNRTREQ